MAKNSTQSSPAPATGAEEEIKDVVAPVTDPVIPDVPPREHEGASSPEAGSQSGASAADASAQTGASGPDVAVAHFTDVDDTGYANPSAVPSLARGAAGSQYEIIYEVRGEGRVKEVGVHVTARSESEAFDLASKAVEALSNEDNPITWRYTGRFRKVAA